MNHNQSLESSLSTTQPPAMPYQGIIKVTSTDDDPNPGIIGEIKPEHPIAIDTVFRRISRHLDSADLISCSQIWWNCYQISKEIFGQGDTLTVPTLRSLNLELVKPEVQNIGHLTLQDLQALYNDDDDDAELEEQTSEMFLKLIAEHPKLKHLSQLTLSPTSIYRNKEIFRNLLCIIGHRLQVLCIKGSTPAMMYLCIKIVYQNFSTENLLFPISRHGNREAGPQQLLECKNMKRLVLDCYTLVISTTGITLTFPNLVELYLKGIFEINSDELQAQVQTSSKQQAKGQVKPQQPSPQKSRPQLLNLRKLSIIYESALPPCDRSPLSVLAAMEGLQLKYLELQNVLYDKYEELITDFLGKQSKTLETLKLLSTPGTDTLSYPTKLPKFFLPGKFLKLQEITLSKLFINDKFKETLQAIPNTTKITFQIVLGEIWESILETTNLNNSDQPQSITKVNIVGHAKNSKMPQPKAMPPKPTMLTTHKNIKEIYITGVVGITADLRDELEQIFPNCVNISLNPSI